MNRSLELAIGFISTSMRKTILVNLMILILVCTACVREDIVDTSSKHQPKMFVIGFLTPDSAVEIYVGRTIPFGNNKVNPANVNVFDAEVWIREEGGDAYLLKDIGSGMPIYRCSKADFAISAGKTYVLEVNHRDLPNVLAKTTVPAEKAQWKDLNITHSESAYYTASGNWEKLPHMALKQYGVRIENLNPYHLYQGTSEGIFPTGNDITLKREIYLANRETRLRATLLTMDIHYGEFSKIADLIWDIKENFTNAGFAEVISGFKGVIPQHSNIAHGAGVFGSYLTDTKVLAL